jgi:hypothetical protein
MNKMVWFRLFLGSAQTTGATMSLFFLVKTGLSPYLWIAFAVTTFFTIISRIVFWKGKGWQPFFGSDEKKGEIK